MTHITAEFGRKTSVKVIPSKEAPTTLSEYLARYGEARLGEKMREAVGLNGAAPEMPDNSDMLDRPSYRGIAEFLRATGGATSREISDALSVCRNTVNTRLWRLSDAGFARGCRDMTRNGWPLVWSLVEGEA